MIKNLHITAFEPATALQLSFALSLSSEHRGSMNSACPAYPQDRVRQKAAVE